MNEGPDRLHEEFEQYGARWRATVPPARLPGEGWEPPQPHRSRLLVPGTAAAAILAVVLGVALTADRATDGQSLSGTTPTATPTTTATSAPTATPTLVAPGGIVHCEPLDPTGVRFDAGRIDAELTDTDDPADGGELRFVVTLTAREGDVSLGRCPDYSKLSPR